MNYSFRPTALREIIGQENIKKCLQILIDSTKHKGHSLPHLLFDGAPGLGKTTFATAMANELGVKIQIANGGNLRSIKYILPYLSRIEQNSILFIDEIHRLSPTVDEFLYPVLEDFRMDLSNEEEVLEIELKPFTMIGATTDSGTLSKPLYDRFVHKYHLEPYNIADITKLLLKNSQKIDLDISEDCAIMVGERSRGTPRIANNLLRWVQDYKIAHRLHTITRDIINKAMTLIGIDKNGFDKNDRKYLKVLKERKLPVGLKTLSSLTNLSVETIENVVEPFLIYKNLVVKTSKGRIYNHASLC